MLDDKVFVERLIYGSENPDTPNLSDNEEMDAVTEYPEDGNERESEASSDENDDDFLPPPTAAHLHALRRVLSPDNVDQAVTQNLDIPEPASVDNHSDKATNLDLTAPTDIYDDQGDAEMEEVTDVGATDGAVLEPDIDVTPVEEEGKRRRKRTMKTVVFDCVCGELIAQVSDEVPEPREKEGLQECKVLGCETRWVSSLFPLSLEF